jgi:hypothetical protein
MSHRGIIWIAALALTLLVSVVHAQMSPDEAMKRLEERQTERAASATQPSGLTVGQVDDLRREIEQLKSENAGLKAKIDILSQDVSTSQGDPGPQAAATTQPVGFTGVQWLLPLFANAVSC